SRGERPGRVDQAALGGRLRANSAGIKDGQQQGQGEGPPPTAAALGRVRATMLLGCAHPLLRRWGASERRYPARPPPLRVRIWNGGRRGPDGPTGASVFSAEGGAFPQRAQKCKPDGRSGCCVSAFTKWRST